MLLLLLIYGLRLATDRGRTRPPLTHDQRMLIAYACLRIIYVAAVGNFLDVGGNHRVRFTTDPLYVVLLGLAVQHFRLRARRPLGEAFPRSPTKIRPSLSHSGLLLGSLTPLLLPHRSSGTTGEPCPSCYVAKLLRRVASGRRAVDDC